MRIRKNTKLSSMLLATTGFAGEIPETYLCQLNQSPWDVIPVTTFSGGEDNELTNLLDSYWFLPPPSSSSSSSSPRIHKFNGEEEDKLNGINVSFGDTNGVSQRLNNLVSVEKSKSPEVKESVKSKPVEIDLKTPGDDDEKMVVSMPAPPKRGRPRGTTTKKTPATATVTLTANPYEFYYYSGFGPRWGRKRGGGSDGCSGGENNMSKKSSSSDDNGEEEEEEDNNKTTAFGNGSNGFDGFDFMEEDYDDDQEEESEDDDDDDHKKRKKKVLMMKKKMKMRKRKPVKERSLKSLM